MALQPFALALALRMSRLGTGMQSAAALPSGASRAQCRCLPIPGCFDTVFLGAK